MNEARYFLPHLLALSTRSPFWMGRNTGLKSYRTTVFRRFPRTGIPDHFDRGASSRTTQAAGEAALHRRRQEDLVGHPAASDVRHARVPHLRRADASSRETIALAALVQAIVVKLYRLRRAQPRASGIYRRALIEENKWRAARYGLDGKLIDFGKRAEVPMRDLALELLEFVDDVVDELGAASAVEYVHTILREGTSADRQLAVFRETGDLRAVVGASSTRRGRRRAPAQTGATYDDEGRPAVRARIQFSAGVYRSRQRAGRGSTASPREIREAGRHEDGRAARATASSSIAFRTRSNTTARYLKHAVLAGHVRHQQSVLVDGRRQVLQLLGRGEARRRDSEDGRCCRRRRYPGGHGLDRRVAAQPGVSDRLGRAARLRRPPGDSEAVFGRRLETRLQGADKQELLAAYDGPLRTA